MAAPATTVRSTPTGIMLADGFSAVIAFERDVDVSFWEKTVGGGGLDGGDPISITTMHNTLWRTMSARQLITLTAITSTVGYDPNVHNNIVDNLLNQEGSITINFPDASTLDFFGFLQTFERSDLAEGESPEATVTIQPTNYDPVNNVEAEPVLTGVSGT